MSKGIISHIRHLSTGTIVTGDTNIFRVRPKHLNMRISSRYIMAIVSFFPADGEDHRGCRRPPTPPGSVASYYRDGDV